MYVAVARIHFHHFARVDKISVGLQHGSIMRAVND